jgi:predicted permease
MKRDPSDFDEEIASHIALETERLIAEGVPPNEAASRARRTFGNVTRVREAFYESSGWVWGDQLAQDVRYGLRLLRNNPLFTATAVLTLAIGIGANTSVFSVVNNVLLRPLPYPKPDELVDLKHRAPGVAGMTFAEDLVLSPSMYFTYAEQSRSFQSLGVWRMTTSSVTGLGDPEQVRVLNLTHGVLRALSVPPVAGRWLSGADEMSGQPSRYGGVSNTVMLSYGYWQRHFGGARSVIGRNITIDSHPREIVGVMPRGFRVVDQDFDLIVPLLFDRGDQVVNAFTFRAMARLKPGVTIAQANADLARLIPIWLRSWPGERGTNPRFYESFRVTPAIRPLKDEVVGNVRDGLWVVMGAIGLVMLIACANVTNLLLVRGEARQRELAIRMTLGASTRRVVMTILTESLLLGLLGGAAGVGLAYLGLRVLVAIGPANLPRLSEISIDPRTLGFALIVALLSALSLGLIPALKYAVPGTSIALRSAGRTSSASRERHRTRNVLVVAQVAIALVLLISAGLMIRTLRASRTVEPGFTEAKYLQLMRISIPESLIPNQERVTRTQNAIVDKLATIPEITSVAFANEMPMEGIPADGGAIYFEDKRYSAGEVPAIFLFKFMSPGFPHTIGARIIAGRELTWTDVYDFRPVVLVSENLARELWGSPGSALGKRLRQIPAGIPVPAGTSGDFNPGRSSNPLREVVGVVQDLRENGVQKKSPELVYWPFMVNTVAGPRVPYRAMTFVMRTERAGSESLLSQVRKAVWSVNANLPLASVRTMQDVYDQSLARMSFTLVMLGIAATMALILGVVGLYGVISYAVLQRRREIGIRLALGAEPRNVSRTVVGEGLALAGMGVAIGLCTATGLTRLMKSLLFGISPLDPLTFGAVPLLLVMIAVLASYLPARRAGSVDPVKVLKEE